MKEENHINSLKESIDVIEATVNEGNMENRQKTIAFHCSSASIELLEIFLHRKRLIGPGHRIKHNWFASNKKIEEKLDFDFEGKKRTIDLMMSIENQRNILMYGTPQTLETIKTLIKTFRSLFDLLGGEEFEK